MEKENIKPTTVFEKDEEEMFTLEDKDYLLIKAINNLAHEIKLTRIHNG